MFSILGCEIPEIVEAMMKCPANSLLRDNWSSVSVSLGFNDGDLSRVRMNIGTNYSTEELYVKILTMWVGAKKKRRAALGEFVKALEIKGLNNAARCIKDQFYERTLEEATTKLGVASNSSQRSPVPISATKEELDFTKNDKPFEIVVTRPNSIIIRVNDRYKLPAMFKGYALIRNVTEFNDPLNLRPGANNDTKCMGDLWTALGYKVIKHEEIIRILGLERI